MKARLLLVLSALSCTLAVAQVPDSITYQGYLEHRGSPVDVENATLTFRLHTHPDAGKVIWVETQKVNVRDGVFSVILGSENDLSGESFDRPLWLSVAIGDAAAAPLLPRTALAAAPYCLEARNLSLPFVGSAAVEWPEAAIMVENHGTGSGFRADTTSANGFEVGSAGGHGLYVVHAVWNGVGVYSSGQHGLYIHEAGSDGVHVNSAGNRAGYFGGDVHITGNLTVDGTYPGGMSDRRLKANIRPTAHGLRDVLELHPVDFDWKQRPDDGTHIGLIAQQVESIIPQVVTPPTEKNEYYGIAYIELIPVLIKAVQEQQEKIQALERRLAAVEGRGTR